eukprot:TRINITY_DN31714_c0_g1_i1.p1 TRINITY_DN31714_c0_g1~~TRINITY_DN31714_c0_g1_i1.p1  ORF type:complete len:958 (+),score=173.89 TRINITY_DN31714_c0_g1_i1:64-2937(+)
MAPASTSFQPPSRQEAVQSMSVVDAQKTRTSKGKVIVMMGAPASGKGTQCKKLTEKLGLVHLSTGDMFRDIVKRGTELGSSAKSFLEQGNYVPDEIVMKLVRDRISDADVQEKGCLLDGFPRTAEQAKELLRQVKVDGVFFLDAPEETLIARAADRRMDPETGAIYHLKYVPPPADVVPRLVRRDRDDEDSFRQRIRVFKDSSKQVLPQFSGSVCEIDATREPDKVLESILTALRDLPTTPTDAMDVDSVNKAEDDEDEWSDDDMCTQEQESIALVIEPCEDLSNSTSEAKVMISAQIPEAPVRTPADICCVIDVSGSMGSAATYETDDGKVQDDGLSVLDIVKHATKTVLKALQDGDRLAIVAFNDKAATVLPLTPMNACGHEKALEALDTLYPNNQTNIWAGILAALDALRAGNADTTMADRQRAILLLTDGQPNIVPPRGHVTELRDYMDTHPSFTCQINTFGFGYNLNSELLLDLAKEGNGTYAFIPDAVIVGTTFVNSVANVLSTLSQSATLNLMPRGGAEITGQVLGGFSQLDESWGKAVSLGPLQFGQSREIVVPMRLPSSGTDAYLEVVLTYPRTNGSTGRVCANASSRKASKSAVVALCRADVVGTGYTAILDASKNEGERASEDVAKMCARLAEVSLQFENDPDSRLVAIKADADGRMSKALNGSARFNRWGKHYLRALMRSHQLQICTNFMDPGLQVYGGTLFQALRAKGDQIFLSLPPPTPQKKSTVRRSTTTATTPSNTNNAPNMTTYYAGAGGGCFAPSSLVRRVEDSGDEMPVQMQDVRAGDTLRVADGGIARVVCLAKIRRGCEKMMADLPGGLRITPGHPIFVDGEWRLPKDVEHVVLSPCAEGLVYNLLLDRCHVLEVDGVKSSTWAHGLEGAVIGHPFFGTQRVVDALSAMRGWDAGFVQIQATLRDIGGTVVGFADQDLEVQKRGRDATSAFISSSL